MRYKKYTPQESNNLYKGRQKTKINYKETHHHQKLEPLVSITMRRRIPDRKRESEINQK
jgi:hypothetical protein